MEFGLFWDTDRTQEPKRSKNGAKVKHRNFIT